MTTSPEVDEEPFTSEELMNLRWNWDRAPELYSYRAGRWLATVEQLQADLKSATASYRAASVHAPCNCRETCGDVDDEIGTCKSLRDAPEPPLVEIITVRRDDI